MNYISQKIIILSLILIYQSIGVAFSQSESTMNKNIYKIDSTEFEFETIGIIGVVTEDQEFCWAMDLYAKSNDFQGNNVSPKFSFTQLQQTKDYKYNESFSWKGISAYDNNIDDWIASFYIYDSHYFIADIEIEKIDKENFLVSIKGKVNLNWETAPTKDFRNFKILKIIPFNGIISELDDERIAFKITEKYIDTKGFKWIPKEQTSSGENNWLAY